MDQNVFNKGLQKIIVKKSLFLVAVVLLIFFVSALILFGDYSSKAINYQNQNQQKLQKIDRVAKYNKSNKELKEFLTSLPKQLGTDELANQVEDYAVRNHIDIVDVLSKDPKISDHSVSIEIHLSVKVRNFNDLVLFFHVVETSPFSLKVDFWSGKIGDANTGLMDGDINIIATQIKI